MAVLAAMNFTTLTISLLVIYLLYFGANILLDLLKVKSSDTSVEYQIKNVELDEMPAVQSSKITFSAPIQDQGIPMDLFLEKARNMSKTINF